MCISAENYDFSPASPLKNCKFFVNIFFFFFSFLCMLPTCIQEECVLLTL